MLFQVRLPSFLSGFEVEEEKAAPQSGLDIVKSLGFATIAEEEEVVEPKRKETRRSFTSARFPFSPAAKKAEESLQRTEPSFVKGIKSGFRRGRLQSELDDITEEMALLSSAFLDERLTDVARVSRTEEFTPELIQQGAQRVVELNQEASKVSINPAAALAAERASKGDFVGMLGAIAQDPKGSLAFFMTESMARNPWATVLGVIPVLGTFIGSADATQREVISREILAEVERRGGDVDNPDDVATIFKDAEFMLSVLKGASDESLALAGTETGVEVATLGFSRFVPRPMMRALMHFGSEVGGETLGEAARQKVEKGKVNWAEAGLEGIMTMGQSAATVIGTESFRALGNAGKSQAQQEAEFREVSFAPGPILGAPRGRRFSERRFRDTGEELPTPDAGLGSFENIGFTEEELGEAAGAKAGEETFNEEQAQEEALEFRKRKDQVFGLSLEEREVFLAQDVEGINKATKEIDQILEDSREGGLTEEQDKRIKELTGIIKGEQKQRGFAKRVSEDPTQNPDLAVAAEQVTYRPTTDKAVETEADKVIADYGVNGAIAFALNPKSKLEPNIRVTVGFKILEELDKQYLAAPEKSDTRTKIVDQQFQIVEGLAELGTTGGLLVRAFGLYTKLRPEAYVQHLEKRMRKSYDDQVKKIQPQVRQMQEAVDEANETVTFEIANKLLGGEGRAISSEALTELSDALAIGDIEAVSDLLPALGIEEDSQTVYDSYSKKINKAFVSALSKRLGPGIAKVLSEAAFFTTSRIMLKNLTSFVNKRRLKTKDMSKAAVFEAIQDFLLAGVPKPTAEQKTEVLNRAINMTAAPNESFIQANASKELLAYISRQEDTDYANILQLYWYANTLSGAGTQGINAFGSGFNLFFHTFATAFAAGRRPALAAVKVMAGSQAVAKAQFKAVLRGEAAPKFEGKFNVPSGFDQIIDPDKKTLLNSIPRALTYVIKLLVATDAYFYRTALEGRAGTLVAQAAVEEGKIRQLKRKDLSDFVKTYVSDKLFGTVAAAESAVAQARTELVAASLDPGKNDNLLRRAYEIIEGQRDAGVREESDRSAALTTFTNKPEGTMGAIAGAVNQIVGRLTFKTRYGNFPVLKPIFPFVNVIANVATAQLDYTPVGIVRGLRKEHILGSRKEFTSLESKERIVKGIMGTTIGAMTYAFFASFDDDEDPFYAITAVGPRSFKHRQQLRTQGWKPYTFKIGTQYIDYKEWIIAIPLMFVGAIQDAKRYEKLEEKDALEKSGMIIRAFPEMFLENSFLKGGGEFYEALMGERKWESLATSQTQGLVPFSGLLRDVSRITNPVVRDGRTIGFLAKTLKDIPVVKGTLGKPKINILGEPIRLRGAQRIPIVQRFGSSSSNDPVWRFLAKHRLFVSDPRFTGDIQIITKDVGRRELPQVKRALAHRLEQLGPMVYGVMDEDEVYEYIRISGIGIKKQLQGEIPLLEAQAKGIREREVLEARILGLSVGEASRRANDKTHEALDKALRAIVVEERRNARFTLLGISLPKRRKSRPGRGGDPLSLEALQRSFN